MKILQNHESDITTKKRQTLFTISMIAIVLVAMLGITLNAAAQSNDPRDNTEEMERNTQELMDSIRGYTEQQRDVAVTKVKQTLIALDKHTERMQERIEANMQIMSTESQEVARNAMEKLREQRAVVNVHLGNL